VARIYVLIVGSYVFVARELMFWWLDYYNHFVFMFLYGQHHIWFCMHCYMAMAGTFILL
jgi:hypothetical protein